MVNSELHCVQLFIQYIRLVTARMLYYPPYAAVYCPAVCCVLHIVLVHVPRQNTVARLHSDKFVQPIEPSGGSSEC
jgi:hypothetical protein